MTDIFYRTGFEKANPYHDPENGQFTSALGRKVIGLTPKGKLRYHGYTNEFGNVPGHEISTQTRLQHGERAPREFNCSCGDFSAVGYDRGVKQDFQTHIESSTAVEKANPYHDRETGQFTTADGGWSSAGAKSLKQPDGGFTVMGGKDVTSGYAVSPYPERSRKFSSQGATRKQIKSEILSYSKANEDLLSKPGNALGGWHDPATGDIYLDVSIITDTPELAAKVALEHDQIAYFDFQTFESVTVNPDAKSGQ